MPTRSPPRPTCTRPRRQPDRGRQAVPPAVPSAQQCPGLPKFVLTPGHMRLIFARMHTTFNRRRSFRTSLPTGVPRG
ncbi:hypothetical protein CO2235_210024 [Cupriavidus oxalaticus]|uniref:Uncharacterized protein n=1 Tax=Cupriavidus oxalaticus TaxID=96344 RepID=A0A375G4Y0_9BURK|nr:hypothetical protein CO2235_210024 [Cupriavidus oxalaticus]